MVDAARQMLDELMGRNRNLHPSEAPRSINWEDPEYCQYHIVKFCPHDLFINTRADLGPCCRIHDDEAKQMYEEARPSARKRQYEDEFLHFCNSMLNDVDRKIQKGKQRLQLMHRDQPMAGPLMHLSKYQEQLNNLNARIKKLLAEAEEAGIRGDVDQAQDLMTLCEQLKEEKDALVAQHESTVISKDVIVPQCVEKQLVTASSASLSTDTTSKSPQSDGDGGASSEDATATATATAAGGGDKKVTTNWVHDLGTLPEKQMEVCEVCGAFLIVGDAQQRIEDHLMGKQHLGYSKLRKAVEEIHERRQREREQDERKRRDNRSSQPTNLNFNLERRRDNHEYRGRSRDHGGGGRHHHPIDRSRHHHKVHHRRSHSRSNSHSHHNHHSHNHRSRDHYSRSRSRSRY